jgi:hypothetical protein
LGPAARGPGAGAARWPHGERIDQPPPQGEIEADFVINCAGLHCDRVARSAGLRPESRIIPFRGDYWKLSPSGEHLVRHLIYPVPDPTLPFLGVHFTRMIGGGIEAGPNAVLAFKREGYAVTKRGSREPVDFELERQGRVTLVCARRWKSAHTGVDMLRALHQAQESQDAQRTLYVGLGELTGSAQAFAHEHRIEVWQGAQLAARMRSLR